MAKVRKVIFKNTVDREAFISIQQKYLSLPGITCVQGQYSADTEWDNPRHDGKPMITVEDNLIDLPFDEFTEIVSWDTYKEAAFDFQYLKKVPGSDHNLVDFTSSKE